MPSTYRIPAADLRTPLAKMMSGLVRRRFGQVPDGLAIYWHHRPVLRAVFGFESKVQRWKALDPTLKAYAEPAPRSARFPWPRPWPDAVMEPVAVNGALGLSVVIRGDLDTVVSFAVRDGQISGMFAVRNPAKLARFSDEVRLAR